MAVKIPRCAAVLLLFVTQVLGAVVEELPYDAEALRALGLSPQPPVRIVSKEGATKTLHGRFLHITDIHPDPYYKEGLLFDEACHRGKGKAGAYGDAMMGCDSPVALMNETIAWIEHHLADKIDFIVWTGDNVRHDNDRRIPRTEQAIFNLNQDVAERMLGAFKHNDNPDPRHLDVPLVPLLGNNDVYPHNMFAAGPTLQTRELWHVWHDMVPPEQLHTFVTGAYYFAEVVPNQLAVLSINTLYWFNSNPLVDDCDRAKQPGYQAFQWLGAVLTELRERNMKVWLLGHVPPVPKNYDPTCLRKFTAWIHEYRDIIVGGVYGHMNIDHFYPLDSVKAYQLINKSFGLAVDGELEELRGYAPEEFVATDISEWVDEMEEPMVHANGGVPLGKVGYLEDIREAWYAKIKGKRASLEHSHRYAIAHISALVVPTFNPGFRVWEYNTSGIADAMERAEQQPPRELWGEFFARVDQEFKADDEVNPLAAKPLYDKTFPKRLPADMPLGPAYTPQTFLPVRYVQYYADLQSINKGKEPFGYQVQYSTDDYAMELLLVDDWLDLGRDLGKPVKKDKKKGKKKGKRDESGKARRAAVPETAVRLSSLLWKVFVANLFIRSGYENTKNA